MIAVYMYITKCVYKITWLQITNLGDHHCQQSVRSNIERNSQKNIRTSLVKLATQSSICYIKLEQGMTRHQSHFREISNIPCTDDQPPAIRVLFNLSDQIFYLVYYYSILSFPTPP